MKIDEMFPLQYYVNLDEREDRKELAEKEFDKLGIHPQRFSAIKHKNGAVGCYLSHLNILKIAEAKKENVLIFEDDVQFIGDYNEVINKAMDELDDLDWHMGYFGGNILRPAYQVTPHWAQVSHCQSTHAYFVHKNFVPSLVAFLERNRFILDVLYAEHVVTQKNCYITVPMVAIQRTDFSSIEKQEMSYDIPIERYNKFLVKKEFYEEDNNGDIL